MKTPQVPALPGMTPLGINERNRARAVARIRDHFSALEIIGARHAGEFSYAQAALIHCATDCLERFLDSIADEEGKL